MVAPKKGSEGTALLQRENKRNRVKQGLYLVAPKKNNWGELLGERKTKKTKKTKEVAVEVEVG